MTYKDHIEFMATLRHAAWLVDAADIGDKEHTVFDVLNSDALMKAVTIGLPLIPECLEKIKMLEHKVQTLSLERDRATEYVPIQEFPR